MQAPKPSGPGFGAQRVQRRVVVWAQQKVQKARNHWKWTRRAADDVGLQLRSVHLGQQEHGMRPPQSTREASLMYIVI